MDENIYSGTAAKEIDRLAIDKYGHVGLSLMKQAGESAFARICVEMGDERSPTLRMLVLCGGGNNGGDGYVVARCGLQAGWKVEVIAYSEPSTSDARAVAKEYVDAGGTLLAPEKLNTLEGPDVIVDALLGVGINGKPREPYAAAIEAANRLSGFKVAIDVPSGIDADTGHAHQPNFQADLTVTYIVRKLGLLTGSAKNSVGKLVLYDLGIDPAIVGEIPACARLMSRPLLPQRPDDSHKGSYGHVVIVGGDDGMLGAVLLAGKAALRCGSGKVHIMSTDEHLDKPPLYSPELMSAVVEGTKTDLLENADALVVGPGLGLNSWGRHVFEIVIRCNQALVIDADALQLLAATEHKSLNQQWVLTPHPGEAAKLLNCTTAEIQSDRLGAVRQIAKHYNCICVLKGAGTLISDPAGNASLCDLGNPGMATAGMGDVLSGMIASFAGQGLPVLQAAEAGVWLHAHTADYIVRQTAAAALIAGDISEYLPVTLAALSGQNN